MKQRLIILIVFLTFIFSIASCKSGSGENSNPENNKDDDDDNTTDDDDNDSADDDDTDDDDSEPVKQVSSIEFSEDTSFIMAEVESGHLAFPDLTKLNDGRLMLVYRQGVGHVESAGKIMKQFGALNENKWTWTEPEILYDEPNIDDRDPSIATLKNGDVVINYFQYTSQTVAAGTFSLHSIFFARSKDNGKTFGDFKMVDSGRMSVEDAKLNSDKLWEDENGKLLKVQASSSAVVELNDSLIIPSYGGHPLNLGNLSNHPRSCIYFFVSNDGGASWQEQLVNGGKAKEIWLQEPALINLDNNKLALQVRTSSGVSPSDPGKMSQAVSTDFGITWSDWKDLDFIGHAPELYQLKNGVLLSAFRQINDAYTKEMVSFIYSLDRGETWSEPEMVEDCGAVECGYPAIVELDNESFLMAFYTAGGKSIKGTVYKFTAQYK